MLALCIEAIRNSGKAEQHYCNTKIEPAKARNIVVEAQKACRHEDSNHPRRQQDPCGDAPLSRRNSEDFCRVRVLDRFGAGWRLLQQLLETVSIRTAYWKNLVKCRWLSYPVTIDRAFEKLAVSRGNTPEYHTRAHYHVPSKCHKHTEMTKETTTALRSIKQALDSAISSVERTRT